ncbi:MAG: hypothetical protein WA948_00495 [Pontixanthobacter sp.]
MKRTIGLALAAIALTGTAAAAQRASQWSIGPVIHGQNYSVGMDDTLRDGRAGPWFDFPYPNARAGHVHYVTRPVDGLDEARAITLRYRIDAAPGTHLRAREHPDRDAALSLYFQRRGDDWSARGAYETYRWYAMPAKMMPLTPGTHEVTIDLKDDWKAVGASRSNRQVAQFRSALADAGQIGFTFGSRGGRGHGVYATGPARFTLLKFQIR